MNELPETTFYRTNDLGQIEEVDMETGEVTVHQSAVRNVYKYTLAVSEVICSLLRNGKTLTAISRKDGMPPLSTLYTWRRVHPDFEEKIRLARTYAAEHLMDRVQDIVDECSVKEDVHVAQFKANTLIRLAEKQNPEKYGTRTKITGDANAPMMLIVDTGIRRHPTSETIEVNINNASNGRDEEEALVNSPDSAQAVDDIESTAPDEDQLSEL